MSDEIFVGKLGLDFQELSGRPITAEILQKVEVARIHADDKAVGVVVVEQHTHQCAPMAGTFAKGGLNTAEIGKRGRFLVEQVFDRGNVGQLPDLVEQALADVPLLADHDHQLTIAA